MNNCLPGQGAAQRPGGGVSARNISRLNLRGHFGLTDSPRGYFAKHMPAASRRGGVEQGWSGDLICLYRGWWGAIGNGSLTFNVQV